MDNNKININKTELKYIIQKKLYNNVKCSKSDIYKIIDSVFNTIEEELVKGNNVNITNFGKFTVSDVKQHYGLHPQDSTLPIKVDSYKKINFKPGESLKNKINNRE